MRSTDNLRHVFEKFVSVSLNFCPGPPKAPGALPGPKALGSIGGIDRELSIVFDESYLFTLPVLLPSSAGDAWCLASAISKLDICQGALEVFPRVAHEDWKYAHLMTCPLQHVNTVLCCSSFSMNLSWRVYIYVAIS